MPNFTQNDTHKSGSFRKTAIGQIPPKLSTLPRLNYGPIWEVRGAKMVRIYSICMFWWRFIPARRRERRKSSKFFVCCFFPHTLYRTEGRSFWGLYCRGLLIDFNAVFSVLQRIDNEMAFLAVGKLRVNVARWHQSVTWLGQNFYTFCKIWCTVLWTRLGSFSLKI